MRENNDLGMPKFVENAIQNIIEEPSKSIGATFSDIWYLVLGGKIGLLAEKKKLNYAIELEKYKQQIENEISKIPSDMKIDADIQTIGNILEKSKYCVEKESIRDIFSKLIASSMHKEKSKFVHPIFVNIVSNMSENDAKTFYCIIRKSKSINLSKDEVFLSIFSLRQLGLIYSPDMEFIEKVPQDSTTWLRLNLERLFEDIEPYGYESGKRELLVKSIRNNPNNAILDCELSELGNIFKDICS